MAYGPQFTEMLLNKQGQQAQINEKAALENAMIQQEQQKQLVGALGSAGTGIAGALKTSKDNGIANALMNKQDAPMAAYQATVGDDGQSDGSVPMPAGYDDSQTYGNHSGGVEEMTLQMNMAKQRQADMESRLLASHANYYDQIPTIRDAQNKMTASTRDFKDNLANSNAYTSHMNTLQNTLQDARAKGDQKAYDAAAQNILGAYHGALTTGIKGISQPVIPAFNDPTPGDPGWNLGPLGTWGAKPAIPAHTAPAWNGQVAPFQSSGSGASSDNSSLIEQAKAAIANGKDPTVISQRLQSMGVDPSLLNQ